MMMIILKWTTLRNSDRVLLWHKQQSLRRREILTLEENPGMMSLTSLSCFSSRQSLLVSLSHSLSPPSSLLLLSQENGVQAVLLLPSASPADSLLLKSCAEPDASLRESCGRNQWKKQDRVS